MEKKQTTHQGTNSQIFWHAQDIESLAKALTFAYKSQKTYSQPLDLADRVEGWKFILGDKYHMNAILGAIKTYMTTKSDMPVPADIEAILNPPKPKITQAEYINAQKQHALEGYPMYGYYGGIIREYEAQEAEGREKPLEIADSLKKSIGLDVKRIG